MAGRLAAVWRSAVGGRPAIAEWAAGGIRSYRLPQSFRWSFRHARHRTTRQYQLDGTPDLSSKNGTERDGVDGRGSTSNR